MEGALYLHQTPPLPLVDRGLRERTLERYYRLRSSRGATFPGHFLPGRAAPPRPLPLAKYTAGYSGLQRHWRELVEWGWKEAMALLSLPTPGWMRRKLSSVAPVTKAAWVLVAEQVR